MQLVYTPQSCGLKNETGYAFTRDMNDEIVIKLTNQNFTKDLV